MGIDPAHMQMDADLKYRPELHPAARLGEEPERSMSEPPPVELYDLVDDPGETCNLASREPQRAAELLRQLESWFAEVEAERRSICD